MFSPIKKKSIKKIKTSSINYVERTMCKRNSTYVAFVASRPIAGYVIRTPVRTHYKNFFFKECE